MGAGTGPKTDAFIFEGPARCRHQPLSPLNKHRFYLLPLTLLGACGPPDKPAQRPAQAAAPVVPAAPPSPPVAAPDKLAAYAWDTESCHFTGRYNPRRYSKTQLDNTWQLLAGSAALDTDVTPLQPADISQLNADTLAAEYARKITFYRTMRVVAQPIWRALKKAKIQELEDDYQAKKLTLAAFADPAILLTAAYPGGCQKYAQALASGNDSLILRDWRRLAQEQQKRNSNPKSYLAQFEEQYNSADRLAYAKIDLLTYGWWNCANTAIRRAQATEEMHQKFPRLFTDVQSECDDVD